MAAHPHHFRPDAAVPRPGALLDQCIQRADGSALAAAAIRAGHEVVIVSGPVEIEYPVPQTTWSRSFPRKRCLPPAKNDLRDATA